MHWKRFLAAGLLGGGLVACGGGGNSVSSDEQFDIKSAKALVNDAGAGKPQVVQVLLMNQDVSCDQLKTYLQQAAHPDPNSENQPVPPFSQGVVIGFPNAAVASHQIMKPVQLSFNSNLPDGGTAAPPTPTGDAEVIEEAGGFLGLAAISGTVNVTGFGSSAKGTFDTQSIDLIAYLNFEFGNGKPDANGNPQFEDGGAIPQHALSGSFDASVCP